MRCAKSIGMDICVNVARRHPVRSCRAYRAKEREADADLERRLQENIRTGRWRTRDAGDDADLLADIEETAEGRDAAARAAARRRYGAERGTQMKVGSACGLDRLAHSCVGAEWGQITRIGRQSRCLPSPVQVRLWLTTTRRWRRRCSRLSDERRCVAFPRCRRGRELSQARHTR
jgi:hypothetical protein